MSPSVPLKWLVRHVVPRAQWTTLRRNYYLYHSLEPYMLSFIERVSLLRFLILGIYRQSDTSVRFAGNTYIVRCGGTEIYDLQDLYVDRHYSRNDDFIAQPGWLTVDVGANIGTFTIEQAKRGAKVFSFEPNPECYRRLCKAVALNGIAEKVQTLNVAAGRSIERAHIVVPEGGKWTPAGKVIGEKERSTAQSTGAVALYETQVATLDCMLEAFGVDHIDLLKIDVEGAEADVLAGAQNSLSVAGRVIVEYHTLPLLDEIRDMFRSSGLTEVMQCSLNPKNPHVEAGLIYAKRLL